MTSQHIEQPGHGVPALRTLGDIRAALRAGYGFPGDREDFELDLLRALERSTETDLQAVAAVIVDYRGRIRIYSDPEFDIALQEGEREILRIRRGESSS
ncbi:hypothetical protein NLX86_01230 [Streptomyces sp. A3M-1-3]|uniref:hypothetical protein n=1 Tax=Streptomyces sp. A3M-1-3 TaxID=2962044 RepID=UPI0020B6954A|nr:hypothetical protein [Streptomyces sp. A3M-1-3]MCP3816808.1 hypothetical protein [Streptomyces sp. A3M-1-3]